MHLGIFFMRSGPFLAKTKKGGKINKLKKILRYKKCYIACVTTFFPNVNRECFYSKKIYDYFLQRHYWIFWRLDFKRNHIYLQCINDILYINLSNKLSSYYSTLPYERNGNVEINCKKYNHNNYFYNHFDIVSFLDVD